VRSVVSFAGEPDQALAKVVAAVEAGDRPRRLIDTVEHVLEVTQLARPQPARQVVERDVLVFRVVEDNETFDEASTRATANERMTPPMGTGSE
jgi:hypothetical protein